MLSKRPRLPQPKMQPFNHTVTALSTPPGKGGVALIAEGMIGETGKYAAAFQNGKYFLVSDFLRNPMKRRGGEHQIIRVFAQRCLLKFSGDDGKTGIILEFFFEQRGKMFSVFHGGQLAARFKNRRGGLACAAADFQCPAGFVDGSIGK